MLKKGDRVEVAFEWFRDPGMAGGGFWIYDKGTVIDVAQEMFSIEADKKQRHLIPFTAVKFIHIL